MLKKFSKNQMRSRVLKKFLVILCLVVVTCPIQGIAEENPFYVAVAEANIRSEPTSTDEETILATLKKGDQVIPTGKKSGLWIEVDTGLFQERWGDDGSGKAVLLSSTPVIGWIKITLLTEEEFPPKVVSVACEASVNLREEPSKKAKLLKKIEPGSKVTILSTITVDDENWSRILIDKTKGWLKSEFL